MTPRPFWYGVILVVLTLTSNCYSRRYEDLIPEDQDDTIMWENLAPVMANNMFPILTDNDLALLLDRPQPVEEEEPQFAFPKLTKKQRLFAENPSTIGKDNTVPELDAVADLNVAENGNGKFEKKDTSNDESEEVKDPLAEESKDKKASLISRGDTVSQAHLDEERINDIYFTTIVAVSSALVAFAVVGAGICYHRYQKKAKAAEDVEYPAYGVTGNGKDTSPTSADRKLAQNAQLYHYQHQKQQMLAFDSNAGNGMKNNGAVSDNESDEDNEEGDYTVYECPGLAPTGEMEVRNPMFDDDSSTPKPEAKKN